MIAPGPDSSDGNAGAVLLGGRVQSVAGAI